MNHLFPTLLALLWLAGPVAAQSPASFEFNDRPATSVFDQAGILPPARVAEISAELSQIRAKEGIDVIVVVLKTLDGAPPEHVAQRFAEAWCNPLFHSVVLYAPGENGGPWIVPGGKLLRIFLPEVVAETVAQAQRRAACEIKPDEKIQAAATEASDMLRIWAGDGVFWDMQRSAQLQQAQRMDRLGHLARKLALPAAATLLIVLAAGTWFCVRWFGKRRRRQFPEPTWTTRLGAPYAGGNDSTVRF